MKKLIALILCFIIPLTGCTQPSSTEVDYEKINEIVPEFTTLNDKDLLAYIEDKVYEDAIASIDSDEYAIEEVQAIYVSKEYLEELQYNSESNIYFGYTAEEINKVFQGTKYVFTLGDNGETTVKELEEITETSNEKILKNLAIGTGVILVTVSAVPIATAVGAPAAVTTIIACSAKSAQVMAVSAGAFGGGVSAAVAGVKNKDLGAAAKAFVENGSEEFKFGAIVGSLSGAAGGAFRLHQGTKAGLTMNEVALIQKESKYPMDVISQFRSMDEYNVYKEAGLKAVRVNGKTALVQDIDMDYVSKLADGTKVTNRERMLSGKAPIDPATKKPFELHHINQKNDGTLAILNSDQHRVNGTDAILHDSGIKSEIDRKAFKKIKKDFWKYVGNNF